MRNALPYLSGALFLFGSPVAGDPDAKTFWIQQECHDIKDSSGKSFADAIREAITYSGVVGDKLKGDIDESLKKPDPDHHDAIIAIKGTFERIGMLEETTNRDSAYIRMRCDDDQNIEARDGNNKAIPLPTNLKDLLVTKVYDRSDDFYELGSHLCDPKVKGAPMFRALTLRKSTTTQTPGPDTILDKNIIKFCPEYAKLMQNRKLSGDDGRYLSEDFANLQLDHMGAFYNFQAMPLKVIIHELTHIDGLSKQYLPPGPLDANIEVFLTSTRDRHGIGKKSGYYNNDVTKDEDHRTFPGPRLDRWLYTIMNADSYAYFALINRFVDLGWQFTEDKVGTVLTARFRPRKRKHDGN